LKKSFEFSSCFCFEHDLGLCGIFSTNKFRKAKMNIQFETSSLEQNEAQGLILLLSTLFPSPNSQPVSSPAPQAPVTLQTAIDSTTDGQQQTETRSGGPTLVGQPTEAPTRKRRTKAEIAADEVAAKGQAALITAEAEQGAIEETRAILAEAAAPKPISADELRSLLNAYIASHSMEEAIAILQAFGCGRVTEALALPVDKLNELAGKLRG
jgi:hypothetical protein